MADDNIPRILHELESVLSRCSHSRDQLGHLVKEMRVLFKAWPVEKKKPVQQPDPAPKQPDEELLSEEIAELSLVEKALVKAEKTRSRFSKKLAEEEMKTPPSDSCTNKAVPKANPSKSSQQHQAQVASSQKSSRQTNSDSTIPISQKPLKPMNNGSTGVISQGKLNRLLDTNVNKNNSVTSKPTQKRQPIPVYAKAPFQTKPETKRPVKKSANSVNRPATRTQSGSRPGSAKVHTTKSSSIKTIHVKEAETSRTPVLDSAKKEPETSETRLDNVVKEAEISRTVLDKNENEVESSRTSLLENVKKEDQPNEVRPAPSESQPPTEKPFLLAKDGSQLKIPASVSKAALANHRLRVKLHRQQLKQRVQEASSARDRFMQALHKHNSEQLSGQDAETWQQVTAYTNAYTNLHNNLRSLVAKLPSRRSEWQEVVACKHHLAFILSQWKDLEEGYHHLSKVTASSSTETKACHRWKPEAKGPSILSVLPPHILARLPPQSPALRYQSPQSVHAYHDLLHRVGLLLLRRHTLDKLHGPLMDMLTSLQPDSQFYQIYRSAYSLLCTQGNLFPSIVREDEEDDV